jgi:hypothetical protein
LYGSCIDNSRFHYPWQGWSCVRGMSGAVTVFGNPRELSLQEVTC